VYKENRHKL